MSAAVDWLAHKHHDLWTAHKGRDHIFMATHDYATCFDFKRNRATNPLSVVLNSIVLQTFGDTSSVCYDEKHHIVIPPFLPTEPENLKNKMDSLILQANWKELITTQAPEIIIQKNNKALVEKGLAGRRDINCFFIGQLEWTDANGVVDPEYSAGIRQTIRRLHGRDPFFLIKHVTREGVGEVGKSQYFSYLDRSVFCLAPAGFAPWTKRIFEAIVHGCIPVIIADTIVLPFEDQLDYDKLVVRVSQKELAHGLLKAKLLSITDETRIKMQQAIHSVRNAFLFRFPSATPVEVHWVDDLADVGSIGGNAFDFILRELAAKKLSWVDIDREQI